MKKQLLSLTERELTSFFEKTVKHVKCQTTTAAYISNLLSKPACILPNASITLEFSRARDAGDFRSFQILGDWLFFARTCFPEHLKDASVEYYDVIAQQSYWRCYKMLRTWVLFEELSDRFSELTSQVRAEFVRTTT